MTSWLAMASMAQLEETAGSMVWVLLPIAAVFVLFALVVVMLLCLKRCPPNKLLVIYGSTGNGRVNKVLHGGQAVVFPFIQGHEYLSLEPIEIEVEAEEDDTFLRGRIVVAVGAGEETKHNAAVRLLGLSPPEIASPAREILVTEIGETIRSLGGDVAVEDRDAFHREFMERVEPKLAQLGLVLINVQVDRFTTAEEAAEEAKRGNGRG